MLKIAVTGGMGSGKSVICNLFASLGAPVYDSDAQAKRLMEQDPEVAADIRALLGCQAYCDGKPDKQYIAAKIFADPTLLQKMNGIVHPALFRDFDRWCARHEGAPYVVLESAIIVEIGAMGRFDRLVVVTAPPEVRIARVMKRDSASREQVVQRLSHQTDEAALIAAADYIVVADGQQLELPQVVALHNEFMKG